MHFNWQEFLATIGGQAALLGIVGYLIKKLVSSRLEREADAFKADLKRNSDVEIERLKNSLQMAANEHQIRFSKLHEKRAQVLADLYKLLVKATWEAENLASPMEFAGEPDKNQKFKQAMEAISEYFRFFDQHRIYLPEELCTSLLAFAHKLRSPAIAFGVYLRIEYPNERTQEEKYRAWTAAWDSVQTEIPKLRSELEVEFRKLLGATTIQSR